MKKSLRRILRGILIALFGREKLVFLLTNGREKRLLGFDKEGYLYDIGWVKSMETENVVGPDGNPIPWLTYPFIDFVDKRLEKKFEVFEFGSGNSTLYYAGKVASVKSIENDKFWYEKIKNSMPQNCELFFCELETNGEYCRYAAKTGGKYDIVVVDGRDRVNCCKNSINSLKPDGVLILDDANRPKYAEALSFMEASGFKRLDFWGLAPLVTYRKCTSLFYRDNNSLGV